MTPTANVGYVQVTRGWVPRRGWCARRDHGHPHLLL